MTNEEILARIEGLVSFSNIGNLAHQGLLDWKEKGWNKKWWKRIDGTPIPNDLIVCIAERISAALRDGRSLYELRQHRKRTGDAAIPRGAKIDQEVTALLRANHGLFDKRSFAGRCEGELHLYLKGDDIARQRARAWRLFSGGRCAKCKRPISEQEAHMHHLKGGLVGRCDCLHNLEFLCFRCHCGKHVQVGGGAK